MDNGHPKNVGNILPEANAESNNGLDEKEWQRALEISTPAGMPTPENLTKTELASTEDTELFTPENSAPDGLAPDNSTTPDKIAPQAPENPYKLGQITPITPIDPNQPVKIPSQKYNAANIKTTGDKLEKSTIPEIDNLIDELNQTGDLNNFYDEIRGTDEKPGMMEANLHNSFNRKLGADGQGGNQ